MSSKEVKVKQIETAYEYAEKVIAQNQQIIRLKPGNKDACVAAHGQIDWLRNLNCSCLIMAKRC